MVLLSFLGGAIVGGLLASWLGIHRAHQAQEEIDIVRDCFNHMLKEATMMKEAIHEAGYRIEYETDDAGSESIELVGREKVEG